MIDTRTGLALLEFVAARLGPILDEVVFLGGAATTLLITDQAAPAVRYTIDVDVVVETTTRADYYKLGERLRELGFREDDREGAPLCRWLTGDVPVDVMPTDSSILGFSNRWYAEALATSLTQELANGCKIRLTRAPLFLATKIEAFYGRGEGGFFESHDMEDVIAVVDGRPGIIDEVRESSSEVREFLRKEFASFIQNGDFRSALPGHMPPDAASQERVAIVCERIEAIIEAGRIL
jgi:hypothetical protein